MLDGVVDLLRLFGAEMANRTVNELQTGLNGTLADLLDRFFLADSLHVRVRAEFEVDGIGVVDERLCRVFTDELRQVAADLRTQ